MKTTGLITMFLLITISVVPLSAQITREQATVIVLEHIQNSEIAQDFRLYVNTTTPSAEGISITTSQSETIRARYACWVYFLDENPNASEPTQKRYFFVRESNGSLVEIITSNDTGIEDFTSWEVVEIRSGLLCRETNNRPTLFPNPVSDFLIIPCFGKQVLVEIFDLNGNRVFSNQFSGESQLNLSFLQSGTYIVNISGETYRIIKY